MIVEKDEMKYQIALSLIEGVGYVIGKKLLAHCGSAKAVFKGLILSLPGKIYKKNI